MRSGTGDVGRGPNKCEALKKHSSSGAVASRDGGTAMEGMPVSGRGGRNEPPEMIRAGSAEASFRLDFCLLFIMEK